MKAGWNINGGKRREGMANFLEKGTPVLGIKEHRSHPEEIFQTEKQRQGYTNEH